MQRAVSVASGSVQARFFRCSAITALLAAVGLSVSLFGAAASAIDVAPAALAAPAAFGPEAVIAEPSGGFSGSLRLTPDHGPAGTQVAASIEGLRPGQTFDLVWRTAKGRWKAENGSYNGRAFQPVAYRIARLAADANGAARAKFVVPEDFGFGHDVVVQDGKRLLTQANFNIDMEMKISPKSGPLGTPIEVTIRGIGWKYLENSWMLFYDNKPTGWVSSVTTGGTARFTIPATGHEGRHILELLHGSFTFAYRNMQQSPSPDRPVFQIPFTITPGAAVLPPPPEQQAQTSVRGLPARGTLAAQRAFSTVGEPLTLSASGLAPGKEYKLQWSTVTGNRISGAGWESKARTIAMAKADPSGTAAFSFVTPDDLGGSHGLMLEHGGRKLEGTHWIAPSAKPLDRSSGPAGTKFTIRLKGVGWTETANIYAVVYDNAYIGYACGFNSQGDVQIFLHATGAPGWHFVDLYPAIYKGKERTPQNFRLPQLTYARDHPGEDLPRFRFAFKVVEDEKRAERAPR
ncbi:MAG: hypothetical protein AB7F96_10380 [Beijerinckiaceae bacterium]